MDIVVSIIGVAFAAFCIWATVRFINRRERWVIRMFLGIVALAFLVFFFVIIPYEEGRIPREVRADAKKRIDRLMNSLNAYAADHGGRFPTEKQGLEALYVKPEDDAAWKGPYVSSPSELQDPLGVPLQYDYSEDDSETAVPSVWSLGMDKYPGTQDDIH